MGEREVNAKKQRPIQTKLHHSKFRVQYSLFKSKLSTKQIKTMEIIVLGTGCPKCKTLEEATRKAVEELGVSANVTKEEDIVKIMNYGVMRTPALVVNGKVVVSGRVPNIGELKEVISKNSEPK